MPLPGTAFLAIWNDVDRGAEAEWWRWHTHEHLHERAAVRGFLGARRYSDTARSRHRYFTLYPANSISTFSSDPYRARLDNPTPWTARMMPTFRDFLRGACTTVASRGDGLGGAIATLRLEGIAGGPLGMREGAAALCDRIVTGAGLPDGLLAAHLGLADAAVTALPSRERTTRGAAHEPTFEAVLVVEGMRFGACEDALVPLGRLVAEMAPHATVAFAAAYALEIALGRPGAVATMSDG